MLPELRRSGPARAGRGFFCGMCSPKSLPVSGCSLLPAGRCGRSTGTAGSRSRRYFDSATWEEQENLDPCNLRERLTEVFFSTCSPRYLRNDQPVGMSLTGGLDSRMILAWAKASPESLPCYTFGGPYRDCADVRIARQLAKIARQPHTTIRIEDDFFPRFSDYWRKRRSFTRMGQWMFGRSRALRQSTGKTDRSRSALPAITDGRFLRSNVAFGPSPLRHVVSSFLRSPSLLDEAAQTYRKEAAGHRLPSSLSNSFRGTTSHAFRSRNRSSFCDLHSLTTN